MPSSPCGGVGGVGGGTSLQVETRSLAIPSNLPAARL
jgi:hypothetical protein